MNSKLIKLYGFFAVISLLAFLVSGTMVNAQEVKSTLSTADQSRIINLSANMSYRIEATEKRLQDIFTKIKFSHTWMTEAWPLNLPETEAHFAAADDLMTQTRTMLETINQDVYNAATAVDPRREWVEVKNKYSLMQNNLVETHRHLTASMNELSAAQALWTASSSSSTKKPSVSTTTPQTTI